MEVNVFDTYVESSKGVTMHFDVLTEKKEKDVKKAIEYAKIWLKSINEGSAKVTSEECSFCHSQATTPEIEKEIKKNGFYIVKMGGCPQ